MSANSPWCHAVNINLSHGLIFINFESYIVSTFNEISAIVFHAQGTLHLCALINMEHWSLYALNFSFAIGGSESDVAFMSNLVNAFTECQNEP